MVGSGRHAPQIHARHRQYQCYVLGGAMRRPREAWQTLGSEDLITGAPWHDNTARACAGPHYLLCEQSIQQRGAVRAYAGHRDKHP
ncbi:hypothetical protein NDU88_010638 [Pleurodeles waltl]|uniref:Uncharacterized protein n=1 Tax=Pleurodeles waltl TaxID=8319 RepID=A0AAV7QW98_PLEWA|nr:hypothetical protein NDU88_010638 [Pleurodeles waltl]